MHNYSFNKLPTSFLNTWPTDAERREDSDHLNLCNQDDLYVPFTRLSSMDNCPHVLFPKLWNEFTNPCKSTANKIFFKKELKSYFLEKLSDNYQCTRLLCPNCHLWNKLKWINLKRNIFLVSLKEKRQKIQLFMSCPLAPGSGLLCRVCCLVRSLLLCFGVSIPSPVHSTP
jgi:hypothetical protein